MLSSPQSVAMHCALLIVCRAFPSPLSLRQVRRLSCPEAAVKEMIANIKRKRGREDGDNGSYESRGCSKGDDSSVGAWASRETRLR